MSESTDPRPIIALLCDITEKRLGPSRTVWDRSGLPGTFWDHLFYSENVIIIFFPEMKPKAVLDICLEVLPVVCLIF